MVLSRRLISASLDGYTDAVLTVAKGKLMADKLLASGGMTRDKSVRFSRLFSYRSCSSIIRSKMRNTSKPQWLSFEAWFRFRPPVQVLFFYGRVVFQVISPHRYSDTDTTAASARFSKQMTTFGNIRNSRKISSVVRPFIIEIGIEKGPCLE